MATLSWSMTVQIADSAAISITRTPIEAEGVDRIDVTIAPGDTNKLVNIQSGAASSIHLLTVTSSNYGAHLSFKANDGTTDSATAVTLDSPQIFSGGSVALFGLAPRQLKFTNSSTDKPAKVQILVARDATP